MEMGDEGPQNLPGTQDKATSSGQPGELTEEEKHWIMKQLSLIHDSTGHGSYHLLLNALKRRQADPRVIELAKTFRCRACEESKWPNPRRQANLEVHTDHWRSIQVDAATWKDTDNNKVMQIFIFLDEASRFIISVPIHVPGKRGISAQEYSDAFEQHWKPCFSIPDIVRMDPEGTWRPKAIDDYFQFYGVMLQDALAEAHWNLAHVERSIGWIKELLTKLAINQERISRTSTLSHAVYTWNH
eukprot:Skav218153  [mRNA]  locus=scaffold2428:64809:65537:+ [translate_table: standard]